MMKPSTETILEHPTTAEFIKHSSTSAIQEHGITSEYLDSANTTYVLDLLERRLEFGVLLYITIVGLILLVSLSSNFLIIYCVVRIKNLRTVTNVFICNLAISDLLLAAYVMPLKLHDISHYYKDWYEGQIHCKVVNFCPILVISSSIYTLVAISFERRQVMISSLQRGRYFTFRKLPITIFIIWILAAGIAAPTLFEYSVADKPIVVMNELRTIKACGSSIPREFALANAIFVSLVSYVIPVILLTKNYTEIALYVWRKGIWIRQHLEPNGLNSGSIRLFKQRVKVVKLLVLVAAIFALSWLPFFAILFYAKATGKDTSEDAAGFSNLLLLALASFSTAYNGLLYVIFNPSFKKAFLGVLMCTNTSIVNERVSVEPSQSPESPHEGVNNIAANNSCSVEVITTKNEFSSIDR